MDAITQAIEAVLSGASSINAEARTLDMHPQILRRKVMKHPGYERAKEKGLLKKKGLPNAVPLTESQQAALRAAAAEVLAGTTQQEAAAKFGVHPSTLSKTMRQAYPEYLDRKPKIVGSAEEVRERIRRLQDELLEAERTLSTLEG